MRRIYVDKWDDLRKWTESLHSAVSTTVEERLTPIGGEAPALIGLYSEPDSADDSLNYSCFVAAGRWLHELHADVADSAVTLDSYAIATIVHLGVRTVDGRATPSGHQKLYAARIDLDGGKSFEWEATVTEEASRARHGFAKNPVRFVEALREMILSTGD